MLRKKYFIYDVECFPNFFMLSVRGRHIKNLETKTEKNFLINDREIAKKWFKEQELWQVSFNGIGYDDIMIAFWLSDDSVDEADLYELNQYLIEKITPNLKVEDYIRDNYNRIEIMKMGMKMVNHYLLRDCTARDVLGGKDRCSIDLRKISEDKGSLKQAGIILRHDSIKESSIPFGTVLDEAGKLETISYCEHDIDVTEDLYIHFAENLTVRDEFYGKYGIKTAHNIGSAKLAENYLIEMYREEYGDKAKSELYRTFKTYKDEIHDGLIKQNDTIETITAHYEYSYNDPKIQAFYDLIKNCTLTYGGTAAYEDTDVWINADTTYRQERAKLIESGASSKVYNMNKSFRDPTAFILDGKALSDGAMIFKDSRDISYKVGTGGLHDRDNKGFWKANDEYVLYNVDVTSYYPSLIAANDYSPTCFPDFSKYTIVLLKDRKIAKAAGRMIESNSKKLVLNSSFGKTKERHSLLFDNLTQVQITINGQLLLLKLIDMIYDVSESAEVVNANTDGVCFYVKRAEIEAIQNACNNWEKLSRVNLEEEYYERWFQASCNSYCALRNDGKVKSKGSDYQLKVTDITKGIKSAEITKMAIVNFALYDTPVEDTLRASKDVFDYCLSAKYSGEKTKLVIGDKEVDNKMIRFAYTNEGDYFYAKNTTTGALTAKEKGKLLKLVDVVSTFDINEIDFSVYINKAKETILDVMIPRKQLAIPKHVRDDIEGSFEKWQKGINPMIKMKKIKPRKKAAIIDWSALYRSKSFSIFSPNEPVNRPEMEEISARIAKFIYKILTRDKPEMVFFATDTKRNGGYWRTDYLNEWHQKYDKQFVDDNMNIYIEIDNYLYPVVNGKKGNKLAKSARPATLTEKNIFSKTQMLEFSPKYKGNRVGREWEFETPLEQYNEIIADLLVKLSKIVPKGKIISYPGAEADDIAAYLVTEYNEDIEFTMYTLDGDWHQITENNAKLFDFYRNEFVTVEDHATANLFKIIKGDAGDGIPGCWIEGEATRLGKKKAMDVITDGRVGEVFAPVLERNTKLIDLSRASLPDEICEGIETSYRKRAGGKKLKWSDVGINRDEIVDSTRESVLGKVKQPYVSPRATF